ncbi:MAG TPA: DUF72 domain-containing protein [Gemmataceae bacterium]|nr:DUF72 domain-containing protein [Gemmataceae bacterium]
MNIWVGTSGYSYPDWVGPFYPEGTRPNRMLAYYTGQFPLVELNFTFYRPPTPDVLARLADQVPDGFQFLVKVPRTISHEERPLDLPLFRRAVEEVHRRGRLMGLLCQLPQASHYTRRRMEWLDWLGGELRDYHLAIEFRHRSWARPDLPDWMAERHLDLVAVDAPDLPQLYPSGLAQSGSRVYVRLHSHNAANWYLSDKERYDYHYDDAALGEWVEQVLRTAGRTQEALLLFNNCHHGHAPGNARRIMSLFRNAGATVVPPPATPTAAPVQRGLFDELGD